MALILLPYALWKPALIVTLPLAGLYSVVIYLYAPAVGAAAAATRV